MQSLGNLAYQLASKQQAHDMPAHVSYHLLLCAVWTIDEAHAA